MRGPRPARQLRAPHLRSGRADAPAAVHPACRREEPAGSRFSTRSWVPDCARCRGAGRATRSACWAHRPAVSPGSEPPARAAGRRRRGHPAHGFPAGVDARAARHAVESAGADGLGDPVSVQVAPVDDPRARTSGGRDRRHAAARRLGRAEPSRVKGRVSRLLRRFRHAARGRVVRVTGRRGEERGQKSSAAARRRCSRRWRRSR